MKQNVMKPTIMSSSPVIATWFTGSAACAIRKSLSHVVDQEHRVQDEARARDVQPLTTTARV